jgi:predicted 3-demethylubiquinone-9 3-methyltransferase (glyoxalase superfamily)
LVDKFGVSWQVVPEGLGDLMTGTDSQASDRVGQALMGMQKIDLSVLRRAHAGA